jgi:hypothetical protein
LLKFNNTVVNPNPINPSGAGFAISSFTGQISIHSLFLGVL